MATTPADLVTIEHAAELVGRPSGTVRRWTREPAGAPRLATWPGPTPHGGGRPARLVSLDAVRALAGGDAPSSSATTTDAGDVERLRAELAGARADLDAERVAHATTRADLATTRADLAAVRAELAGVRDLVARLDADRAALDAERREAHGDARRQADRVAALTGALAALSADVQRYGQLGPIGRALQAPPSVARLVGPVDVVAGDVERDG